MNDYDLTPTPAQAKNGYVGKIVLTPPAARRVARPAPPVDERPLWQQIADPGYYEGTDRRGTLVRGKY